MGFDSIKSNQDFTNMLIWDDSSIRLLAMSKRFLRSDIFSSSDLLRNKGFTDEYRTSPR